MTFGIQAVGVAEKALLHAQPLRCLIHHGHEGGLVPCHTVGHCQGRVVATDQHKAVQQFLQGQNIPGFEVHGRSLRHILRRNSIVRLEVALFQSHHGSHDFSNAGNKPLFIGVLGIQHPAAFLLHQNSRGGRGPQSGGPAGEQNRQQKGAEHPAKTASGHRTPPIIRRISSVSPAKPSANHPMSGSMPFPEGKCSPETRKALPGNAYITAKPALRPYPALPPFS